MNEKKKRYMLLITGMVMGGAERVMATIANELVERGNEVTLVTMKEAKSAYRLDDRVKFVGAKGVLDKQSGIKRKIQLLISGIRGTSFYVKQLKENNPDIVLSFLTNTNLMAIIVNKLFERKIPVVISERCDPQSRGRIITKVCNWIYPKSSCIICQSNKVLDYFKDISLRAELVVIPNPINDEAITNKVANRRRKVIVGVGRLNKQKNFDLLINSFNLIKHEFPEYNIEIYGQGPEKQHLLDLIKSLGLNERITLMGTRDKVMETIYDSSLYVMSSNFEGFPNALIEAMASGLPVICTDFPTGTANEIIENGKNGYIVPVGDEEKMSIAMRKILNSNKLQQEMSFENKKIKETLDKKLIVDKWVNVLNQYI